MEYKSTRPLASFAEGLIRGCLKHHGVDREVVCNLRGAGDGCDAEFIIQ